MNKLEQAGCFDKKGPDDLKKIPFHIRKFQRLETESLPESTNSSTRKYKRTLLAITFFTALTFTTAFSSSALAQERQNTGPLGNRGGIEKINSSSGETQEQKEERMSRLDECLKKIAEKVNFHPLKPILFLDQPSESKTCPNCEKLGIYGIDEDGEPVHIVDINSRVSVGKKLGERFFSEELFIKRATEGLWERGYLPYSKRKELLNELDDLEGK